MDPTLISIANALSLRHQGTCYFGRCSGLTIQKAIEERMDLRRITVSGSRPSACPLPDGLGCARAGGLSLV